MAIGVIIMTSTIDLRFSFIVVLSFVDGIGPKCHFSPDLFRTSVASAANIAKGNGKLGNGERMEQKNGTGNFGNRNKGNYRLTYFQHAKIAIV